MSAAFETSAWSGRVCAIADLPMEGTSIMCELDGRSIAIFNVAGILYAVDDLCTHAKSSLSGEGRVCGLVVECGLHRAQFSLETGCPVSGPTRKPLRTYDLVCEAGEVMATQVRGRRGAAMDRS